MKLKIVNIKKFTRTMLLILGIFIIVIIINLDKTYSKGEIKYKEEIIIPGDTLWSIANRENKINPYYMKRDIRYIVQDIKEINNLSNSNLSEGQKILISCY